MKNNKTVLVIGAAGFVGPYLVDNLRKHSYRVIPTKLETQKVNDKSFINLDILNEIEIINTLKKYRPNYIVNLAAQANVGLSWKDPIATFNINVIGTITLLEAIKNSKQEIKILLIGTSDVYGKQTKMPLNENTRCKPNNFYSLSKLTVERIGKIYTDVFGLKIIFTRSFNHIGLGQSKGFVIPDICSQVANIEKNKQEPELHIGNLNIKRDFSNVEDIVNAYRLLLEKGRIGEIYNVGSGQSISIKNILKTILKESNKKIKVIVDKNKTRKVDTKCIKADITKLKNDVMFNPTKNINKQIFKILNDFRKN